MPHPRHRNAESNRRLHYLAVASALAWIGWASAASGVQPVPLFSSGFDANSISGTNATNMAWVTATNVAMLNSGNLTSLNGYNFARLGNFSTSNNITISNNLNTSNQTTNWRGFGVSFSPSAGFALGKLSVAAGHVNSSGSNQSYVSTLNYRIVNLADQSVVASGSRTNNYGANTNDVFYNLDFTLGGQELAAGASYRLEVGMNNLASGGAFAIYDGLTLEAYPEPGSNPAFAQRLNFAKYQKDTASAENGSYIADLALDGYVSNWNCWRTGSASGAQSLEINYPRAVTLGSAHIYSGILAATTSQVWQNYRLQYHDGNGWTDVPGSVVGANSDPERNILFSSPVTSSRFRLLSSNTGATSRTLREIAMFPPNPNTNGVEQGYPIGTDVILNLARQRPVVASSISGTNYAINAVDGFVDDGSRWLCNEGAPGETLEIDLLDTHAIGGAHLYSGDLAAQTNALGAFSLQWWDGNAWQAIPGATISGNTNTARVISFSATVATSRVRLVVNDASAARVSELLLFPPRSGGYPLGQDVRTEARPGAAWNDFGDATHRVRIQPTPDRRLGLIDGAAIFTDNSVGAAAVDWQLLLNHRDGSYRIRHAATGLCLGLAAISTNTNTAVIGEAYTGMPHQSWFLDYVTPTKFRILNAYSGLALQSLGASSTLGTAMVVTTPGTSKLQQWDTARQTHYPKKGIAATASLVTNPPFADTNATWITHLYTQYKQASWSYTWGRQRSETFPFMATNHTFNPMQWGNFNWSHTNSGGALDSIRSDLQSMPKPVHLMGFNEPDKTNQGFITVTNAIERWPRLLAMDSPLVSPVPAATSTNAGWLVDFMDQAGALGYRVDQVAVHWYGNPDADGLINLLQSVYDRWQRPVWLTEFSPVRWSGTATWSHADNFNFLAEFLWRAESLPWLARYSLFSFRESDGSADQSAPDPVEAPRGSAQRVDGSLTPYGELYASWDGSTTITTNKSYHLHNKGAYRRAQNPNSSDSIAAVAPDANAAGVQWALTPGTTTNTMRIASTLDGRRLRFFSGTNVGLAPAADNLPQSEWRLVPADQAGWFYLEHPSTSRRLGINTNNNTLVTNAITSTNSSSRWRFVPALNPETAAPPAAPAITSAVPTTNSVTVHWTALAEALTYTLQRSNSTWENLATGLTNTSWTHSGLPPETTISYRVAAANAMGSSASSAPVAATTLHPFGSFALWQDSLPESIPQHLRTPGDDPDADGLVNFKEYALVQNPARAGTNPVRFTLPTPGSVRIEFPWNWRATDIGWRVRSGTNLASQSSWPAATPTNASTNRSGDTDILTLTFPISGQTSQFFTLEIFSLP